MLEARPHVSADFMQLECSNCGAVPWFCLVKWRAPGELSAPKFCHLSTFWGFGASHLISLSQSFPLEHGCYIRAARLPR